MGRGRVREVSDVHAQVDIDVSPWLAQMLVGERYWDLFEEGPILATVFVGDTLANEPPRICLYSAHGKEIWLDMFPTPVIILVLAKAAFMVHLKVAKMFLEALIPYPEYADPD